MVFKRILMEATKASLGLGLWCLATGDATAQNSDALVAQAKQVEVRVNGQTRVGVWNLDASLNPDTYTTVISPGETQDVCFVSGDNSLCRKISSGDQVDFDISHDGVRYPTRIATRPPAAVFDAAYQAANRGRTQILVPEVYELVNIAIALTQKGREDRFLVHKTSPYYEAVMAHFAGHLDHPLLTALDAELRKTNREYFILKMNGYAFEFDDKGRIVRSPVYERTGFNGDAQNALLPFLDLLQDFADKTDFRSFYRAHSGVYDEQIRYYRDQIDVAGMAKWLEANYPAVEPYDGTKIIFSPLVASNQSLTSFVSNGYRELQPHVNFPYPVPFDDGLTPKNLALRRGAILFTEMNHGFINPTARDMPAVNHVFSDREVWAEEGKPSDGYGTPLNLFNEYMNWALVSLFYTDQADPENLDAMIARIETNMVENRGFPQFKAFNQNLLNLYKNRPAGTTLADLYPQILSWSAAHHASLKTAN